MLKNFTYKYFILFYVIYEGKERLAKLLVVLANFGFPPIFFFFLLHAVFAELHIS